VTAQSNEMKGVAVVTFNHETVDPFAGPATTFLTTVPIPPVWFLLFASLSSCLLNGLLNYVLARAADVALLRTRVATVDPKSHASEGPQSGVPPASFAGELAGGSDAIAHESILNASISRYGTWGASPNFPPAEMNVKASRAYERHVAFAVAARRHWRTQHPGAVGEGDDDEDHRKRIINPFRETDSLLSGDQLHFPSSPIPPSHRGSFDPSALEALPPVVYVTPTTNLAQSFAMPGGAAPPVGVEAVVAAANLQSTLKDIRLEAQYVMFDTNRFFLISSTVKCLSMLVYLHYSLDLPGGWKRFTVGTGIALLCGLLTPLVELLCAALLPNDDEVENSRTLRLLQEETDKREKADTVMVVELVLRYCTYDFKDLTTVFIQNTVFVLFGTVLVPPLFGFCFVTFFAYLWIFCTPIIVLYYVRQRYYRELTKSESDALAKDAVTKDIRIQGLTELLKCVVLKWAIVFLCLWEIQASFILAMATKEGQSYWDALRLLWDVQFNVSIVTYYQQVISPLRSVFWRVAVASQLVL
jgi:hypothetical protein